MTEQELKARIFNARVEMERVNGRAEKPTAIVMHPADWRDLKADGLRNSHDALGANSFMGIPVQLDSQRDVGRVTLAWLVEV